MKAWFTVTAVLELGAGLALLCVPSIMVALLLGAPLETPAALSVARIGGAGLLSLGIACGIARNDAQSMAARGLMTAMLLYNIAAVTLLIYARFGYGLSGLALWPGVVLHAGMAGWCIARLRHKA